MTTERELLLDPARRLFGDYCTRQAIETAERGGWPEAVWTALEDSGLTLAATAEARGGPGCDLADAFSLLKVAGAYSLHAPLAETLLAEMLLSAAGLPPVEGPATIASTPAGAQVQLHRVNRQWRLSGVAHRVPWARHASSVVLTAMHEQKPATVVVRKPAVRHQAENFANEPRDTVDFGDAIVDEGDVAIERGMSPGEVHAFGALARACAISGALETILDSSVTYAQERIQFGKPIAKFQAIQQQAAVLAGEVAAASAAVQAAVEGLTEQASPFAIAVAKVRASEAAGIVSAIAHEIHGAMGFTKEHALHLSTRRVWSWREEFGDEREWAEWIGRHVATLGGEALWSVIAPIPAPFSK
ncbi:acyl-CoA/acyl-ACP dehydrogenase [Pigmentiphaga sp. GD03639]|uniref:acyl-CoA dehydrogenase family protein n=1 Tax=unclassified Pigmentiphaga TaxID=2626614 RepID=UPI000B416A1E|nr:MULTISPECIES: acyl-CoA dehydrogenase family protein [unclassified Pigmentiphaga]MDH2237147.1 acyl-CoA/acyl-ACP dehydrogenase [Pigmentiphaga sp. GD03639]OVZ65800.1 hypothetical protein CDO46_02650 [Pigmentiphaga sp. NML030171]